MVDELIQNTRPWLPEMVELDESFKSIWTSHQLTNNGPIQRALEQEISSFLGVKNICLFSSGATALIAAIRVLKVSGSAITTPFTFAATPHSLIWNNVDPIFVDVDPRDGNIDCGKIEGVIREDTTAIVATHCFGNPCDVFELGSIAKRNNLTLIYDAAHAFGVRINDQSVLDFGDAAVLSFHATKVFHTFEGGGIVFNDPKLKQDFEEIRNHGLSQNSTDLTLGLNGKLSELHAAVGRAQLPHMERLISSRRDTYDSYKKELGTLIGVEFLRPALSFESNAAYAPILLTDDFPYSRDELINLLLNDKIVSRRYFWPLITNTSYYKKFVDPRKDEFPNACYLANRVICLPIFAEMSGVQKAWIISRIIGHSKLQ